MSYFLSCRLPALRKFSSHQFSACDPTMTSCRSCLPTHRCMIVNSRVLKLPRAINSQVLLDPAEERGLPGLLRIFQIPLTPPLCTSLRADVDQDHGSHPTRINLVPHQTATPIANLALMFPPKTLLQQSLLRGNMSPRVLGWLNSGF